MTLYRRRERFSTFSVKVGIAFSRVGLSPNQWTLLSLLVIFVAFYFLVKGSFLIAAALFLFSSFLDLVDGSVARVTGKVTRLGAYLDTMVDRYIEGIIIIGLMFLPLPSLLVPSEVWLGIYLFGAMLTSYAKAAAKEKDLVGKEIKGGLLERAERLLILFVGLLLASLSTLYLTYVIVLLAVLSNFSAIQRMVIAVRRGEG